VDRLPTVAASQTPLAHEASEAPAERSWRKLLGGTPREVLARLVQDDPLGIRGKVAARLDADALLLDADRVHLRVLGRISRFASRYRGRPELAAWIESCVAESVQELLREEHEAVRARTPAALEPVGAFATLAPPLGLDPKAMRAACAAFNLLTFVERSAFADLVLRGRSLDEVARAAGESATEVARRARRALDAILACAQASSELEKPGGSR
jgi:DNA-directed RNA polymerase specialized sigma24 family protein